MTTSGLPHEIKRPAPGKGGATVCAACGAPMSCGRDEPGGCWCARLPPLPAGALASGQGCLCPACLGERVSAASPRDRI